MTQAMRKQIIDAIRQAEGVKAILKQVLDEDLKRESSIRSTQKEGTA